jgi:putative membrane protein
MSDIITPGPHRMHPFYIIKSTLAAVFAAAIIVVSSAGSLIGSLGSYVAGSEEATEAFIGLFVMLGIGFAIVVLMLVLSILGYRVFTWEITEAEIHIRSGIIFKKQVHIPYARVQTIDYNARILERIVGVVSLKIDTAGGSANKAVMIPAIKLSQAEALRAEVFRRKRALEQGQQVNSALQSMPAPAGAPMEVSPAQQVAASVGSLAMSVADARGIDAGSYDADAPVDFEYGLSAKELILASISSDRFPVMLATALVVVSQIPSYLAFFLPADGLVQFAFDQIVRQVLPVVILIVVAVVAFLFVVSLIGTMLTYGGFKARRRGGRIEVEYGVLQRHSRNVALPRVQSLVISQGFIRKMMGYAQLRVQTIDAGEAGQQNGQNAQQISPGVIIHPFVKVSRIEGIIAGLLPEYSDAPPQSSWVKLPKVAKRRSLFRWVVWPGAICVALFVAEVALLAPFLRSEFGFDLPLFAPIVLVAAIMVLCFALGVMWYRRAALGWTASMLAIRSGYFGQTTTYIPRRKIQWASARQNPLQRWRKVATIKAVTAAGVGGTATELRDVSLDQRDAYIQWVRPHN